MNICFGKVIQEKIYHSVIIGIEPNYESWTSVRKTLRENIKYIIGEIQEYFWQEVQSAALGMTLKPGRVKVTPNQKNTLSQLVSSEAFC